MLQILAFGQLTDVIGSSHLETEKVNTVKELRASLYVKFPALSSKTFVIAISNKVADDETEIKEGSSIALLPPFSGG